jgi:hypothetical protein
MKVSLSKYCEQNRIPFSIGYQSFKQGKLGFKKDDEIFVDIPDASASKLNILEEQLIGVADKMMKHNNSIMDFAFYILENYNLSVIDLKPKDSYKACVEPFIPEKLKPASISEELKSKVYIDTFEWEKLDNDHINELITLNNVYIIEQLTKRSKLNPIQIKKIFNLNQFDNEKLVFFFAQNKFLSYEHLLSILEFVGLAQAKFIVKAFLHNGNLNEEEIKKIKLSKIPAITSAIEEFFSDQDKGVCKVEVRDIINDENDENRSKIIKFWTENPLICEKLNYCFDIIEKHKKYKYCCKDIEKNINRLILANYEETRCDIYNQHCDYMDNLFKKINCEKLSDCSPEHIDCMDMIYDLIVTINGIIENIYYNYYKDRHEM